MFFSSVRISKRKLQEFSIRILKTASTPGNDVTWSLVHAIPDHPHALKHLRQNNPDPELFTLLLKNLKHFENQKLFVVVQFNINAIDRKT